MTIFQAFRFFRKYGSLIAVPNLDDKAGFRAWCGDLAGFCAEMAKLTDTTLDDTATDAMLRIISDDQSFDTFYTVLTSIIDLVSSDDVDDDKVGADGDLVNDSLAGVMAERVGLDPVTIISLIMMAARFIKWLRARREG